MNKHATLSSAGLLIALGIIYGDIGTSPLYVFNAICNGKIIDELLIIGGVSCIIWTLTLQTTLKADNKGEGGTVSLFALIRRHRRWMVFPAMIGSAALLADGMITPPISVTSAVEGLRKIFWLHDIPDTLIMTVVICILYVLFFSSDDFLVFRKCISIHHDLCRLICTRESICY